MPEHPRASTSDDVECFFSMLRDAIGKTFTGKQVQFSFRKLCLVFCKRVDPDLPFYYHTSSHTHYTEGPLASFDQMSTKMKRKNKRLPGREQTAAFAGRRATMPVHGSLGVRAQFHNQPIESRPPPTAPIILYQNIHMPHFDFVIIIQIAEFHRESGVIFHHLCFNVVSQY